jgi:hypothetical protein
MEKLYGTSEHAGAGSDLGYYGCGQSGFCIKRKKRWINCTSNMLELEVILGMMGAGRADSASREEEMKKQYL